MKKSFTAVKFLSRCNCIYRFSLSVGHRDCDFSDSDCRGCRKNSILRVFSRTLQIFWTKGGALLFPIVCRTTWLRSTSLLLRTLEWSAANSWKRRASPSREARRRGPSSTAHRTSTSAPSSRSSDTDFSSRMPMRSFCRTWSSIRSNSVVRTPTV